MHIPHAQNSPVLGSRIPCILISSSLIALFKFSMSKSFWFINWSNMLKSSTVMMNLSVSLCVTVTVLLSSTRMQGHILKDINCGRVSWQNSENNTSQCPSPVNWLKSLYEILYSHQKAQIYSLLIKREVRVRWKGHVSEYAYCDPILVNKISHCKHMLWHVWVRKKVVNISSSRKVTEGGGKEHKQLCLVLPPTTPFYSGNLRKVH